VRRINPTLSNVPTEVRKLRFIFNGVPEDLVGCEMTIQDLLNRSKEDQLGVIVEVNGRFVYRKDFRTFTIKEGDRVEFIHPSFGG